MSWIITGTQRYQPDALLDQYPGAAAAYSLRNLVGTSNPAVVRVRRDNDNSEADFTATEVSDGTLAAWVGAGNDGFVRTWYDQSGNARHAEQATTASQPQIVSSGAVVTQGSKPAIDLSTDYLTNAMPQFTAHTIIAVVRTDTKTLSIIAGTDSNVQYGTSFGYVSPTDFRFQSESSAILTGNVDLERLFFAFSNSSSGAIYANSFLKATGTSSGTYDYNIIGGRQSQNPLYFDGKMQEMIFYSSDQSANRVGIESNINAHYSIF